MHKVGLWPFFCQHLTRLLGFCLPAQLILPSRKRSALSTFLVIIVKLIMRKVKLSAPYANARLLPEICLAIGSAQLIRLPS